MRRRDRQPARRGRRGDRRLAAVVVRQRRARAARSRSCSPSARPACSPSYLVTRSRRCSASTSGPRRRRSPPTSARRSSATSSGSSTRLRANGLAQPLLVMQASGGLTSVLDAAQRPIVTLDSGPTGGILGCQHLGQPVRREQRDLHRRRRHVVRRRADPARRGAARGRAGRRPVQPADAEGAGATRSAPAAASIAWLDEGGLLRVGPQSAGSRPGPACYGLGGTEPTVTDADLVLGYLDPDTFLGGRMRAGPRPRAARARARSAARSAWSRRRSRSASSGSSTRRWRT